MQCRKGCRGSILVGGVGRGRGDMMGMGGTGGVGTGRGKEDGGREGGGSSTTRNIDMVIVPNHTSTIMRIGTWM